jgi:putative ABC transport system permease protein
LIDALASALRGVGAHKLRSFLTILGIVIGVAAVISLMSVGQGAQARILENIETLGANLLQVRPGQSVGPGGIRGVAGGVQSLTLEDADAIASEVPHLDAVAPVYQTSMQIVAADENTSATVAGTTSGYFRAYGLDLARGTLFSDYDYHRAARVAVLGATVAETLFGNADPVGAVVKAGGHVIRIVGVLQPKGASFTSPDEFVLVPLTAMQQMVAQPRTTRGESIVSTIALSVTEGEYADEVKEAVGSLLRSRHRLDPGEEDDFSIMSTEEIAGTMTEVTQTLTMFLGAIAAISLLVGGIGVMNIMLVSVLERRREIGIRKALGAQERSIWLQFLTEAALLSFSGGLIGVASGWGVASLISYLGYVETVVAPDIVVLAVSVSVGVGLFFGFYPAWQASRLDPIEALRME